MPLTTEDLEQVLDYLKAHPGEWIPTHVFDLAGRISNVEAELKLQRETMVDRFDAMDRRFEALQKQMDERFTALQKQTDERFEAVDRRFESMQKQMDERFEAVDRRFESMDKRFDEQSRHMNRWMTAMTIVLALVGVAMTVTNVIG